ncbi:MAG: DUF401 family protein [Bacillota bacterium]
MVILTLIIAMAITLFLVSKKLNIGYSLMIGSVILALLNGKGLGYIPGLFYRSLLEKETISLSIIVALISIMGYLMDKYLIMDRMVTALERILRSAKATLVIAPALLGTLLVTGGALMSCPVVDSLGTRLGIPADKKAAINMVFRHALYFVFPLSSTILVAAKLGGFNVWDLIKLQAPVAIVMYAIGFWIYLGKYKEEPAPPINTKEYMKSLLDFTIHSSPIMISLLGVLLFGIPFEYSLFAGIIICIVINIYDKSRDSKYRVAEPVYKTVYKGLNKPMVLSIIGIMIFKNAVNDIQAIFQHLNNMLNMGMPLELLIIIASALISFPLASTQSGLAILYPMILPLAPNYEMKVLYASLIYVNAFLFYYVSPVHLCQVLTLEYFKQDIKGLFKNYRIILPAAYLTIIIVYIIKLSLEKGLI